MNLAQLKRLAAKHDATIEILNGEEYCIAADAPEGRAWCVDPCRADTGTLICEAEPGESKAAVHRDIASRMQRGTQPYVEAS